MELRSLTSIFLFTYYRMVCWKHIRRPKRQSVLVNDGRFPPSVVPPKISFDAV